MQDTSNYSRGVNLFRSICSACLGFLLCCCLLLVGAVLIDRGVLPEHIMEIASWISVAISALLMAFGAAGRHGRRIFGSLCAGIFFFLLALLCGQLVGGVVDAGRVMLMGGIIIVDSILGAILSGLIRG